MNLPRALHSVSLEMPPRLIRPGIGLSRVCQSSSRLSPPSVCLICAHSQSVQTKASNRRPRSFQIQTRKTSTLSSQSPVPSSKASLAQSDPRVELQNSLRDLQKHASRFVNLSRLQLALHGVQQPSGDEPIRIAILGLADGGRSYETAKEFLRLLLADPLKAEEEWERTLLEAKQTGKPLLLKVGYNGLEEKKSGNWLIQELPVSTPSLNGHKLEFLILEVDPPVEGSEESFAESILVPSMEIPTSNNGRYTPVTTPVHKCLVIGEGLLGASSLAAFPSLDWDVIGRAVNVQLLEKDTSLPFQVIDVSQAATALGVFRQSVENALDYEHKWFDSGLPEIVDWIKSDTGHISSGEMKEPVRKLIESLLFRTATTIQNEEATRLATILSRQITSQETTSLLEELSAWSEQAHTELRDKLDSAFDGDRWRKLSWWKLFWRVDDVSMISNDILNRNFLPFADSTAIYLAGQIAQAKDVEKASFNDPHWAFQPDTSAAPLAKLGREPLPPTLKTITEPRHRSYASETAEWPTNIPLTRDVLSSRTIPALQALAQKLVLQTLTTSSFASIAAGLMYVSTISTGLYEAGAVAALGVVWSMRRMQGKWEAARAYWEGEVREEGRKAIKGVEGAVKHALTSSDKPIEADEELERAKEILDKAEKALQDCK